MSGPQPVHEVPQIKTAHRLVKILIDHLGVTEDDIGPDVLLVPEHDRRGRKIPTERRDLGCDSLDIVELAMAVECEFNVEIPDDVVETWNDMTFGQLVDSVHAQLEPIS